jgi:hypothetical protein
VLRKKDGPASCESFDKSTLTFADRQFAVLTSAHSDPTPFPSYPLFPSGAVKIRTGGRIVRATVKSTFVKLAKSGKMAGPFAKLLFAP